MFRLSFFLIAKLLLLIGALPGSAGSQEGSIWTGPIQKCWSFESEDLTNLKNASDNDKTVFIPLLDGTIKALDSSSGKPIWSLNLRAALNSQILINQENLYVSATTRSADDESTAQVLLFSVDIDSGINIWTEELPPETLADEMHLEIEGFNLLLANHSGKTLLIQKSDRRILWQTKLETSLVTPPVVHNDMVFIGTSNKTVVVLSKITGKVVNQISIGVVPTSIFVANDRLVVGDKNGTVHSYDSSEGRKRWTARTGGEIVQISAIRGNLLVNSNDNFVYLIDVENGKKIWKRRLSGRILGTSVFEDQIAVFVSSGSNQAVFVDLANGKLINRLEIPESAYFVGPPLVIGKRLILPTNKNLTAYSPECAAEPKS